MPDHTPPCPDCEIDSLEPVGRRDFLRVTGATAAALTLAPIAAKAADSKKPEKPAETLIKELFSELSAAQKKDVIRPWNEGMSADGKGVPNRMKMFNAPIAKPIKDVYTKPQWELVERILRAISSGDEGYDQLSRDGGFDNSGSLENCGAYIFGEPVEGKPFAWVFTGHHLTVRCDGNSVEGAAFGGPIYYGHSVNGFTKSNSFYSQTKAAMTVLEALSEEQKKRAVIVGSPGEQLASVQFRKMGEAHPGLPYTEMSADQKDLVEKLMRAVLSPYRKEDTDEVMEIIKATGGMEKMHLAYYNDKKDSPQWHFWRLEGPGFVWNFRTLPHVHTFVQISSKIV